MLSYLPALKFVATSHTYTYSRASDMIIILQFVGRGEPALCNSLTVASQIAPSVHTLVTIVMSYIFLQHHKICSPKLSMWKYVKTTLEINWNIYSVKFQLTALFNVIGLTTENLFQHAVAFCCPFVMPCNAVCMTAYSTTSPGRKQIIIFCWFAHSILLLFLWIVCMEGSILSDQSDAKGGSLGIVMA